ncbi:DUF2442 domain-containing protein [Rugamonas apoptosis]|uniref:DUF2442 domain-containing protein n=1 Tax=Rugamonas apoptosis TaxID=2758570 RepID=A0A7W2F664_9BURK|nr:DUF2442 domain-containing protein [Rugamonas apoptosis]MBA5685836.1 DUF2442 domain-containing protein [Rugamonas apoptosis]
MAITDRAYKAANRRGAAIQATFPAATAVGYDRRSARVIIKLASGLHITFAPRDVQGLENAQPDDLTDADISPSGLGIHFPKLDADLYLPALLEGFLGTQRWMAAQRGKAGGSAITPAKAAAARENGKLGGRPRKEKATSPK